MVRPRRQRNHLPPEESVGRHRTEVSGITWLTGGSHPDRVAEKSSECCQLSEENNSNHHGKKFIRAMAQEERIFQKGHYEDLIETWRKTHSRPETGEFKTEKNRKRYVIGYEEHARSVRAWVIPFKTDQEIFLDEVVPSLPTPEHFGKRQEVTGWWWVKLSQVAASGISDAISREEMDRILRQKDQ
ncbi:hypothetical protein Tco_0307235 [Tanacetum coccineum]